MVSRCIVLAAVVVVFAAVVHAVSVEEDVDVEMVEMVETGRFVSKLRQISEQVGGQRAGKTDRKVTPGADKKKDKKDKKAKGGAKDKKKDKKTRKLKALKLALALKQIKALQRTRVLEAWGKP